MADEKPVAELRITRTPNGCHRYELFVAGSRVWLTHARATVVEREGAKGRMRRWLAQHPHEVQMTGPLPPVSTSATDQQEIAFWQTFELILGGRNWQRIEQLLGTPTARPTTIAGWNKLFEAVDRALKKEAVA